MSDFRPLPNRARPSGELFDFEAAAREGRPGGFIGRLGEAEVAPKEMTLLDIMRVLRRRWVLVFAFVLPCLGAAAYMALSAPTLYRANAVIRLQDTQKTLTGIADATEPTLGSKLDPLLSLLQVMRSEIVLADAVDHSAIRLREEPGGAPPAFIEQVEIAPDAQPDTLRFHFSDAGFSVAHRAGTMKTTYGEAVELPGLRFTIAARPGEHLTSTEVLVVSRQTALSSLRVGLVARQRGATNIVDVSFTASDPILAQVVTNEVVEAFRRSSVSMSQSQSRRRRVFLEDQLRQAEVAQEEAQLALSRFRSREQLYSSQTRMSAEQQGLMGVDVQREELMTERRFYGSILAELERSRANAGDGIGILVASPAIASNPVVSSLLQQLLRYESEREELVTGETGVRPDHPDVQRVQTLIASTQERLLNAVRSHLNVLDSRIVALNRLGARGAEQMRQLSETDAEEVRLTQQLETTRRLTQSLEGELQKARIAEAVETGQVEILEMARLPGAVGGTAMSLILLMGLMTGVLLGAGTAFAVEHLNTSIRREGELETLLRVPGLAVIPRIATTGTLPRRRLSFPAMLTGRRQVTENSAAPAPWDDPGAAMPTTSAGAEAYRNLRTNLIFSRVAAKLKTAVVTSAVPREGKSTTAANLAVAFAQHGMAVLLIDADLRRPRQHQVFNIPQSPGLTDLLVGNAASESIRETPIKGLSVLPAGTLSPNPAELVGGNRMEQLLTALGEQFDLILIDTPPLLSVADGAILSVKVDGTIVVVHAGRTDRDAVATAVQKLNAVGARVIGTVLNDPDARVAQYTQYYKYGYEYTSAG